MTCIWYFICQYTCIRKRYAIILPVFSHWIDVCFVLSQILYQTINLQYYATKRDEYLAGVTIWHDFGSAVKTPSNCLRPVSPVTTEPQPRDSMLCHKPTCGKHPHRKWSCEDRVIRSEEKRPYLNWTGTTIGKHTRGNWEAKISQDGATFEVKNTMNRRRIYASQRSYVII